LSKIKIRIDDAQFYSVMTVELEGARPLVADSMAGAEIDEEEWLQMQRIMTDYQRLQERLRSLYNANKPEWQRQLEARMRKTE